MIWIRLDSDGLGYVDCSGYVLLGLKLKLKLKIEIKLDKEGLWIEYLCMCM